MTIHEDLSRRILILDGAMGSMIQSYGLDEADFVWDKAGEYADVPPQKGNNDVLSLTRPDVVLDIHRRYLESGADIITTNTFSAQRISLADYHCAHLVRELNLAAVRLARQAAESAMANGVGRRCYVAGDVGPTNTTASLSPDVDNPAARAVTYDELYAAYRQQIEALVEGGVDLLLLETVFDTLNAKAALHAAHDVFDDFHRNLPVMVSMTVNDRGGHTLSGQSIGAFLTSIEHVDVLSVGLNCSFGAAEMLPFLREVARDSRCAVSCHPNAGLPDCMGRYTQTPEEMAVAIRQFAEERLVNIVGGCCGTTPQHIAAIAREVSHMSPRPFNAVSRQPMLRLSGLERLTLTPEMRFVNVGERCNVAGSRKFLRLINEKSYDEACTIARRQVEDGAMVLDINLDDGLLDTEREMVHFLRLLGADPEVARIPFMIDSSRWEVIRAALKSCQGKCIVNSISLKGGEDEFLSHARELKTLGAAVVVMAFDEEGQATSFERRTEICQRAYTLLTEQAGIKPEDIIFDPNILAICTGFAEHRTYALDFIRTAAWIRANLPGAHISGGVSNLSFSFRGNNFLREAMHAVFLYHAMQAGMDMAIVNPSSKVTYSDIPEDLLKLLEAVILRPSEEAEESLVAYAASMVKEEKSSQPKAASRAEVWREGTLQQRLDYAMEKGIADHLEEDLRQALEEYPNAVSIIEGPLMQAMERVGQLFGEGKMMLPQVVKTARTMKKAVAFLQPFITEGDDADGQYEGVFVTATVKGDVHDIGKNIVNVVLGCNKYRIVDLGVMVPAETIVEAVVREKADFVGLSGLITPSLEEMVHTARAMQQARLTVPLLLGGATTSALHTALKVAPEYDGPVLWVKDASQMVLVAARLKPLVKALRAAGDNHEACCEAIGNDAYVAACRAEYAALVEQYQARESVPQRSIEEARANRLELF
ncbi:MAG: methionine synthase [Alloprevotella sp.]